MHSFLFRSTLVLSSVLNLFLPVHFAEGSGWQFFQALSFPGGPALVAADFNNDGKLDIATGNSVLLGNGDGTFQAPLPLSVTGSPVVTADFNNDGKPDLAIVSSPTPSLTFLITILLGNGDGTFRALPPINMGTSLSGFDLKTADINKDGKADLVGVVGNSVFVLLGHGDGTFGSPTLYGTGTNPPSTVLPSDVNGDGNPDLVVGCGGFLSVLLGNGDGTFQAPIISSGGAVLAAGDLNGNGKIDLIVEISPANILQAPQDYVQLGNGDGTFQVPTNPLPFSGPVALHDIDGDGKLDLIIQNTYPVHGSPFASVFLGVGDGTFIHQRDYLLRLDGSGSSDIVIADFNNDGIPDIAMDSSILLGVNNGTFAGPPTLAFNNDVFGGGVGDFNKDGNPDMAIQTAAGLLVAVGDGSGTLFPAHTYNLPQALVSLATTDLTSDGNLDLVGITAPSSASWNITAMLGAGDGTFGSPLTSSGGSGVPGALVTGDFNGDKKIDVAVTEAPQDNSGPGSLFIFFGNGDGTFASPLVAGTNPGNIVSGDFDGDGKLDLAAASSAGIGILKGNGDGTFQPIVFISSSSTIRLATADLNGDGKLDLVASMAGQTQVLLGSGDGTFQALPALNLTGVTLIGDINGDGKPDLVLTRPPQVGPSTAELDVLPGNGDGTFGAPIKIASSIFGLTPIAISDFNRDSRADIAVSLSPFAAIIEYPFGGIFILLNTTPPDFTTSLTPSTISISAGGQSATTTAMITGVSNFAGTVSLTCSVSPSSGTGTPTCSVSPATVSIGPAQRGATATITVRTTPVSTSMAGSNGQSFLAALGWGTTVLLLAGVFSRAGRRKCSCCALIAIASALSMLSCGGSGQSSAANYTVTLTASSGSIVHTATASVTVP